MLAVACGGREPPNDATPSPPTRPPADAAIRSPDERKQLVARARERFHADDPVGAAALFLEAYRSGDGLTAGVNAAVAFRTAGEYRRALELVRELRAANDPKATAAVNEKLTQLEDKLASLVVELRARPEGAHLVVRIDGRLARMERDGVWLVPAGIHDIEVVEGERFHVQTIAVVGGAPVWIDEP